MFDANIPPSFNFKKFLTQTNSSYISVGCFYCHYFLCLFLITKLLVLLIHSCREKLNSMNLLLYMSPIAVIVLVPAALIMEPNVLDVILALGRQHKYMWLLLFINSTMAYAANLTNFLVTKHTSALTLQVQYLPPSSSLFLMSISMDYVYIVYN